MDKKNKVEYTPIIQDDNGNIFPLPITKSMVEKWLDVLNYFDDDVQEAAERENNLPMYEKYGKVIDEIYNLSKEM